jgi:hypothetical protein
MRAVQRRAGALCELEAHERREHGHSERGGRRVVQGLADRRDRRLRRAVRRVRLLGRHRVLGDRAVAAVARVDEFHAHARAWGQALALLHHAHALEPDHVGRPRRPVEEVTVPDVQLDRVQRGSVNAHQRLARAPAGRGHLRGRRRTANGLDDRGAH